MFCFVCLAGVTGFGLDPESHLGQVIIEMGDGGQVKKSLHGLFQMPSDR